MLGVSVHYSIDFANNSNLRQMLVSNLRFFFCIFRALQNRKGTSTFLKIYNVIGLCNNIETAYETYTVHPPLHFFRQTYLRSIWRKHIWSFAIEVYICRAKLA